MTWHAVCPIYDLPEGEARRLDIDPPVSVFNVDGTLHATDDTCTHEKFSLADGFIDGDSVECPLHMARFRISTGEALCLPATRGLRIYPVRLEADVVMVDVPTPAGSSAADTAADQVCEAP